MTCHIMTSHNFNQFRIHDHASLFPSRTSRMKSAPCRHIDRTWSLAFDDDLLSPTSPSVLPVSILNDTSSTALRYRFRISLDDNIFVNLATSSIKTPHKMSIFDLDHIRMLLPAYRLCICTPRMKSASEREID